MPVSSGAVAWLPSWANQILWPLKAMRKCGVAGKPGLSESGFLEGEGYTPEQGRYFITL